MNLNSLLAFDREPVSPPENQFWNGQWYKNKIIVWECLWKKTMYSFNPRQFPFNIWDFWVEQTKFRDQQSDSLTSILKICLKNSTTSVTIQVYFRKVYVLRIMEFVPLKTIKKCII